MPTLTRPQLIIRLGSHAEKEYVQKTAPFLDGVVIGANLLEATPGATASLAVKLATSAKKRTIPIIIDPMTYTYGTYRDDAGTQRSDLDWIKSDQRVKGKKGQTERKLKSSYSSLAERLGSLFAQSAASSKGIGPSDLLSTDALERVCRGVIDYQLKRMHEEFAKDEEFASFGDALPKPPFVFAPYFYIDPLAQADWTNAALRLARIAVDVAGDTAVHSVICADEGALQDATFIDFLAAELPPTGVHGVWLWFSKFDELRADVAQLKSFRSLVERLNEHMTVFNMHGGFFSLALAHWGLSGISHGIGYGEQKNVVPVIGQSTPTVRYYFPPLRRRLGIPAVQRAAMASGINSSAQFFDQVCDCAICKGVIGTNLAHLAEFGDMHFSTPQSKRLAQTPAAAKRCRYHFLLRRIAERDWIASANQREVLRELDTAKKIWAHLPTFREDAGHMESWRRALSDR